MGVSQAGQALSPSCPSAPRSSRLMNFEQAVLGQYILLVQVCSSSLSWNVCSR
jgi:hypothetical protein